MPLMSLNESYSYHVKDVVSKYSNVDDGDINFSMNGDASISSEFFYKSRLLRQCCMQDHMLVKDEKLKTRQI